MAKMTFKASPTSVILRVKLMDSTVSTGAGKTGLAYNTSGLIIGTMKIGDATTTAYTVAGSTIETITTLGTYAAPTATKCRFKEVDATNHPGVYEIQLADARFATTTQLLVSISGATGLAQCDIECSMNTCDANIIQALGTAITTATAGVPDVNVTRMNNVAATSITAINANQGTTQPINFTGTGATAYAKTDMVNILGTAVSTPATAGILDVNMKNIANAAVSTSTAQIGVNVIQAAGTAWGSGAITAGSIASNAIAAAKIATGAITSAKFAAGAIDAAAIANGAIDAATFAAGAIDAAAIADAAIDIATFAADCKTGSYINAQVKGQDNIDFGALQKASLNAATPASVTGAIGSIATGGIASTSFAAGAINAAAIADAAIDNATFATDTTCRNLRSAATNGAGASTVTLDGSASASDNFYDGQIIQITAGTGIGQSRIIKSYVGSTKIATVTEAWVTAPTSATYVILPLGDVEVGSIMPDVIDAASIKTDAITEIQAGLATATALATVQADTDDIQSRLPAALVGGKMDSTASVTGTVDANVVSMATDTLTAAAVKADAVTEIQNGLATATALASVKTDTGTTLPAAIAALPTDADVQTAAGAAITAAALATASALATVDGIVDAILVDTGTTLPAAVAALPTDADVQAASTAALVAYDPPTKAESDAAAAGATADIKDVLLNKEVILRHANQKPSQYTAGTGGNMETVDTTIDVNGNIETEIQE